MLRVQLRIAFVVIQLASYTSIAQSQSDCGNPDSSTLLITSPLNDPNWPKPENIETKPVVISQTS